MRLVVTGLEAVAGLSLAYLPSEAANTSLIMVCDYAPVTLHMKREHLLLTLHCHSYSRWGRERVAFFFGYKARQYLIFDCVQLIATDIAQDARPGIIDPPLTLISTMGQRVCLSIFWS